MANTHLMILTSVVIAIGCATAVYGTDFPLCCAGGQCLVVIMENFSRNKLPGLMNGSENEVHIGAEYLKNHLAPTECRRSGGGSALVKQIEAKLSGVHDRATKDLNFIHALFELARVASQHGAGNAANQFEDENEDMRKLAQKLDVTLEYLHFGEPSKGHGAAAVAKNHSGEHKKLLASSDDEDEYVKSRHTSAEHRTVQQARWNALNDDESGDEQIYRRKASDGESEDEDEHLHGRDRHGHGDELADEHHNGKGRHGHSKSEDEHLHGRGRRTGYHRTSDDETD